MVRTSKLQIKFFVGLLLAILISSCASIPKMPQEMDLAAKSFKVSPGKSNIYIFRDEFMGGAIGMDLDINGQLIGRTGANTYILATVPAGIQNIVSHAENDDSISIKTEPGKNYFIWQEVKMGAFIARTKLHHILNEEEAKSRILKCSRVGLQ